MLGSIRLLVTAWIISLLMMINVHADVYMDFTENLSLVSKLLRNSSSKDKDTERYFVLNSIPVRVHMFTINDDHQRFIRQFLEQTSQDQPIVFSGEPGSFAFMLDYDSLLTDDKKQSETKHSENVLVFAQNRPGSSGSYVTTLEFDQALDFYKLLLDRNVAANCQPRISFDPYPDSQPLFCLSELSSEGMISQTIIYAGHEQHTNRLNHYRANLVQHGFTVQGQSQRILMMADDFVTLALFSYRPEREAGYSVLDIIQINFTKTLGVDG